MEGDSPAVGNIPKLRGEDFNAGEHSKKWQKGDFNAREHSKNRREETLTLRNIHKMAGDLTPRNIQKMAEDLTLGNISKMERRGLQRWGTFQKWKEGDFNAGEHSENGKKETSTLGNIPKMVDRRLQRWKHSKHGRKETSQRWRTFQASILCTLFPFSP